MQQIRDGMCTVTFQDDPSVVTVVLNSPDHVGWQPGFIHPFARERNSCHTAGTLVDHHEDGEEPGPLMSPQKGEIKRHKRIQRGRLPDGAMWVTASSGPNAHRTPLLVWNVGDEMFPLLCL